METKSPLTLTLSPSAGEREQQGVFCETSADQAAILSRTFALRRPTILPLPFGRGEGRGEGDVRGHLSNHAPPTKSSCKRLNSPNRANSASSKRPSQHRQVPARRCCA